MLRAVGLHVLRYAPDRSVYLFAPAPGVEDASLRAQVALEGLQQQLSLPEPKAWHVFQFMKSCTKKYYDVINVLHESMWIQFIWVKIAWVMWVHMSHQERWRHDSGSVTLARFLSSRWDIEHPGKHGDTWHFSQSGSRTDTWNSLGLAVPDRCWAAFWHVLNRPDVHSYWFGLVDLLVFTCRVYCKCGQAPHPSIEVVLHMDPEIFQAGVPASRSTIKTNTTIIPC